MIILKTDKGKIKLNSRLLTLVLSLSTTLTLTGCSEEKIKEELEIKKKIYMAEEVNQFPNKEYKIKNKAGNSKLVIYIYDSNSNNPENSQIGNVKLRITDSDNSIVDIINTEENKDCILRNLTPDDYTIEVISVPEDYLLPTKSYSFTIKETKIESDYLYIINSIDIPLENKIIKNETNISRSNTTDQSEEKNTSLVSSVKENNTKVKKLVKTK